ncbi:endonuclease [Escherichia coli]|nr:endonuclease [Escherichia coli]GDG69048.1 endonuclease [Escherichia coli]
MKKYIPLVLFVFSCQVFSADIHGRVVRVLDGDTIDVMLSQRCVSVLLILMHLKRNRTMAGGLKK